MGSGPACAVCNRCGKLEGLHRHHACVVVTRGTIRVWHPCPMIIIDGGRAHWDGTIEAP
jgi:hypothetical protein